MAQLRYPVGMQTFSKIIEGGYAYVDKTAYIKPLLMDSRTVYLIGANFNEKKENRGLEYQIEKMK